MGLIGCPETSVEYYHYLPRNNPEERSSKKKKTIKCDIERPPTVSFVGRKMITSCLNDAFEKNALRLMFTAVKRRCTFL